MAFYSLNFLLIAKRSSISQQFYFNFYYFYFGILSSLLMTFMSHLINYNFTLVLLQHSGFHKLSFYNFILNNTPKNITTTLGTPMCPYGYSYRTPARDGVLQQHSKTLTRHKRKQKTEKLCRDKKISMSQHKAT